MPGQLSALAIINIGRGPACLHPAVVDVIFSLQRKAIGTVCHGEFDTKIREIREGNVDALLDANINPTGDVERNVNYYTEYFCILSRHCGIDQFRQGKYNNCYFNWINIRKIKFLTHKI